jgi:hypothetical protein
MTQGSFFIFILTFISMLSFCSYVPAAVPQEELQGIEEQISTLEHELELLRKKALNAEMHAQPFMFDDWHEFAEDVQASEENEKAIVSLKKKIYTLEEQKQALLNTK